MSLDSSNNTSQEFPDSGRANINDIRQAIKSIMEDGGNTQTKNEVEDEYDNTENVLELTNVLLDNGDTFINISDAENSEAEYKEVLLSKIISIIYSKNAEFMNDLLIRVIKESITRLPKEHLSSIVKQIILEQFSITKL
ncbi:hypothetical protein [Rickettsia endosymbiont of Cardiosporidium cionae]|uniref:hypothetical protein n=1 Tax=Rickettsia endosymbiont of Cardiosporidium cionae TaxID=2777155 RepID=UPI0018962B00|nr:hypothetical protein [Rickettsia endosymbiont of Cardiosporidium cionae]KAF8818274.1 hypothetical protein IHI24_000733 [Rickettsia endosymbiont of Cardiosporidium cionae]